MSKKCVKCGHPLPEDASFCPHCTAIQVEKEEIRAPRRWKKKVFVIGVVLVFLAGVGFAFSLYHKPKVYEANARIVYPDQDHSYRLLVTYSEADALAGQAQGDRTDMLADGLDSALPCQLYVLNEETGEVDWEEFTEKVKSCEVETVPQENSKKLEYMEPVHDENFPNAAYVSNLHFVADTGSNDIFWKLTMKNGDTISLKTRLTIEKQEVVTYCPEDTPMETTEELNTLLFRHAGLSLSSGSDLRRGDYIWRSCLADFRKHGRGCDHHFYRNRQCKWKERKLWNHVRYPF